MGSVCIIMLAEHSPPLYHAYFAMTIFLWAQICSEYQFFKALWRYMLGKEITYFVKILASFIISVFILEILVRGIILILIPQISWIVDTLCTRIVFELLHLILLYAGEKLHGQKDLYLDFLACRCYCYCLSSSLSTMELGSTSLCMASMLVFVHIYFDAC